MNWLCRIFGHDIKPTTYEVWCETDCNFVCKRCKTPFRKYQDTKK